MPQNTLPWVFSIIFLAKKGKALNIPTNKLLNKTEPKKLCNILPVVILLENSDRHRSWY